MVKTITKTEEELIDGVYDIYVDRIEEMMSVPYDEDFGEQAECDAIDFLSSCGLNAYEDKHAREILNAGKKQALEDYDLDSF